MLSAMIMWFRIYFGNEGLKCSEFDFKSVSDDKRLNMHETLFYTKEQTTSLPFGKCLRSIGGELKR